eukprot:CAMPEP_0172820618 /NCGR_PEP_ID=MMETSP1075-20121228/15392_1 /TAXON_ID=2916 /ORGANISM="Ceratium fusus, Strain PA161109" /LENGTH=221 /DNA_ID=CAMNT_0013661327 /DNA_START=216 /DNA_END=879 /DNA_ORIENTATION=-
MSNRVTNTNSVGHMAINMGFHILAWFVLHHCPPALYALWPAAYVAWKQVLHAGENAPFERLIEEKCDNSELPPTFPEAYIFAKLDDFLACLLTQKIIYQKPGEKPGMSYLTTSGVGGSRGMDPGRKAYAVTFAWLLTRSRSGSTSALMPSCAWLETSMSCLSEAIHPNSCRGVLTLVSGLCMGGLVCNVAYAWRTAPATTMAVPAPNARANAGLCRLRKSL